MNKLKPLFYTLTFTLIIIGLVLYLASYFYGSFFILVGLVIIIFYRGKINGYSSVLVEVKKVLKNMMFPFIGIFIAIVIGAIIMLLTGYDPIKSFGALFYGGFIKNWHISLLNSVPLIFTGLAIAFAFQAGLFNIGAEGQYYVGAMVATFLGIYLNIPPLIVIVLIFLISGIIASLYNFIPALLKVKTGAHEVITTMMFAHIARYASSIFIRATGGDPSTSTHAYVTDPILESSWLPTFKSILPEANYRLHIGIIIAIVIAVVVYYILFYTRFGFEIRAVGKNPLAAKTQGISIGRNIFIALLFSGFLAGLAGANQVLGLDHKMFQNLGANYGWNGISVALLASNHPIGVIFTSILWGALDAGGQYMSRTLQVHNSIVEIVKGIILFLVVAKYIYFFITKKLKKRSNEKGRE